MKKIILITGLLIFLLPAFTCAESIELEKKDYLTILVSNYVHGFKDFDTSITSFEDSVSIGIYYDLSTQSKARANQLGNRFRKNIPGILNEYQWAKDIEIIVTVYSEDRTGRGY